MKGEKIKHVINWNLISLISTTGMFVLAMLLNWNQREISVLERELQIKTIENDQLKSELDPRWYEKFNEQRSFFEVEIRNRERLVARNQKDLDSIKERTISLGNAVVGLIDVEGIEEIKISHYSKTKIDSIYISFNILLNTYRKIDTIQQNRINLLEKLDSNSRSSKKNLKLLIENQNSEIKSLEDSNKSYRNITKRAVNWIGYSSLLCFVIIILLFYLIMPQEVKKVYRKLKNKIKK